ncbi:MAG: NAD(P)-binding protein, partial [Desulfomonile sp.]|nr:NAD(P)-binding protein [Desulfomonile sp.]
MKEIVVGRWGSTVRDLRSGREGGVGGEVRFPSPDAFPDSVVVLMSGKGFFLFDETMSFVPLAYEYVRRIQAEYCCGKCLSGIKGTQVVLVTLNRIMSGQGTTEDLDVLGRVAAVLDRSAKCSVCQTAGELIKDGLNLFRDDFVKAIDQRVPDRPVRYLFKISAPCMTTCPCHINIPTYVEMLQEVRYAESLATIREEMPLPGVTGRVCPAPCQKACTLANFGTATIPIKILKRVAADYEMLHKLDPPLEKRELTEPPVAVVGAGPAGLAAAYYLNRLGHEVTIFEALPLSGGMVGVGIPPYRQPKDVLMRDIDVILSLGVKLEQGVRLGRD